MQAFADNLRTGQWLTPERIRVYAGMLLTAYAVFVVGLFATSNGAVDAMGRPIGTDFANVWSSGRMVLEGRPQDAFNPFIQKPYQQALLGTDPKYFYGWHYPPMFLGIAAIAALFPYILALIVWQLTTGSVYVAAMQRILPVARAHAPTLVLATLAYPAVFANITHGHNGFLTAALFGFGLAILPTRPFAAGLVLGMLAYKPQYGLLLPIALAVTFQWRAVAGAAASVIATVAASIALFGMKSWDAFITHAAFTRVEVLENGSAGWFKLQGVFPAIRMYGGSISLAYAAQALTIAVMIAFIIWLWRSPATHAQKSAGLILATMLATPYAFNYDTVVLGAAIAFLAHDALQRGFAPYEKSALALLWVMPLFSRELTNAVPIPFALIANIIVLVMLADKVRSEHAPLRNHAHVV